MTLRCLLFLVFFVLMTVPKGFAQVICTFDGSWDLSEKKFEADIQCPDGGEIRASGSLKDDRSVQFDISLKNVKALLFDITTEAEGVARLVDAPGGTSFVEVFLIKDKDDRASPQAYRQLEGKVDIIGDKIYLRKVRGAGVEYQGQISLSSPFDVDLVLTLQEMLLSDLLAWLKQPREVVSGDVTGEIKVTGFIDKPLIKGKLFSSGEIGKFHFDEIAVNVEGVYPIVRLVDSSVTEANGVTFFLEGQIDLSKDFKDFSQQIARMKMLPLIRQTNVDREWTIRRGAGGRENGETEFKYRLRKERENSGAEETGMLTIQRSIKF